MEEAGLQQLAQPPNSPQLQPIERCFGELENKVTEKLTLMKSGTYFELTCIVFVA